jgi:transposase
MTIITAMVKRSLSHQKWKANVLAAHGKSKEKRSDGPLVTLGLVLDGSGFPQRNEVFAGNASEPKILQAMIQVLKNPLLGKAEDRQMQLVEKNKTTIVIPKFCTRRRLSSARQ